MTCCANAWQSGRLKRWRYGVLLFWGGTCGRIGQRNNIASSVASYLAAVLSTGTAVREPVHDLPPTPCVTPTPQAKTTKKIVLRMQCQECKQTCMKGLKVGELLRRWVGVAAVARVRTEERATW